METVPYRAGIVVLWQTVKCDAELEMALIEGLAVQRVRIALGDSQRRMSPIWIAGPLRTACRYSDLPTICPSNRRAFKQNRNFAADH